MELWKTLLSAALLGTEHSQIPVPRESIDLLEHLEADCPESALLDTAAVAATYRRAGYIAETRMEADGESAPEEALSRCSLRALYWLELLMQNSQQYAGMLLEWMEIIGEKQKRVPHPYLPGLLDIANQHKEDGRFTAAVLRVMGERGKWLAPHAAKWKFLMEPEAGQQQGELAPGQLDELAESEALTALKNSDEFSEAANVLLACRHPWSQQLMDAFMKRVKKTVKDGQAPFAVYVMQRMIGYMPPASLRMLLDYWLGVEKSGKYGTGGIIELIEFRRNMLQELAHE